MTNRSLRPVIAGMLSLLAVAPAVAADSPEVITLDAAAARYEYRPNEVIVKFKDSSRARVRQAKGAAVSGVSAVDQALSTLGVSRVEALMPLTGAETFARKARAYNGRDIATPSMANAYVLEIAEGHSVDEAVALLAGVADVEYAEPNYLVHALATDQQDINDPYYSLQYGIADINLYSLWGEPVISKEGPVIAIIDTGVDISHPDLKANIWTNATEGNGATGYDDDRNGFVDDVHGWDFVNNTGVIADYNGHGTHCAGIAAAVGRNGLGIIGANPDARIMPLTALQSNGTGDIATIIKAVDYAAANGAQIISMSLGSYATSTAFEQALGRAYQKCVLVAAAGNDGFCLNHAHPSKGQPAPAPMFPAAYTFVLGVQASTNNGSLASFSNYDDNGPVFTEYGEEQMYNYEIKAPGSGIMSTYPNGQYKSLNGTSMATPLVAGALSRLLQAKEYTNREELFGDLINTTNKAGVLDIHAAYRVTDKDRKPSLQLVGSRMVDADGDGRADAGEVPEFYPTLRNGWGTASGIKVTLDCAETANTFCEFLNTEVDFGNTLSTYGKGESVNPLRIRIKDNVADGRICRLKYTASCPNVPDVEQEFEFSVENGVELGGVVRENMTLKAGVHYIVNNQLGIPSGVTVTIEPGAVIKFKDNAGLSVSGTLIAVGEPGKMITFTKADLAIGNISSFKISASSKFEYCIIEDLIFNCEIPATNSVFRNIRNNIPISNVNKDKCNIYNIDATLYVTSGSNSHDFHRCNIINNKQNSYADHLFNSRISSSNIFSNFVGNSRLSLAYYSTYVVSYTPAEPNYLGTTNDETARSQVVDINNPLSSSFAEYNISNMLLRPYPETHGVVWKVVVDGYDAQDQYNQMPPLGVGRHKFEVYFNRKMNHDKTPMLSMGVRTPYTQNLIAEDGEWRTEALPFWPLGKNGKGKTDVLYGTMENSKTYSAWETEGCGKSTWSSLDFNGFEGWAITSYSHIEGEPNKLYQRVELAQNGRYKLTISAAVDKIADNNDCQYVFFNDSKVYLDEKALNGAVYEVEAEVRNNEIVVGIAQTQNIASKMYLDNASLTLLEEYENVGYPVETSIYTAYFTITGKQGIDGVNRIYVAEAEDDEFFEIPVEQYRFNVNVQAAGSLSTGFFGEAGLGRVNLTWEDLDMDFEDIMGYNMYRIAPDSETAVMINDRLIDAGTTTYTDFDVVPGKTYRYYYKVMTTDLKENEPSKVIAVTPLTATLGDANGSGSVDVADVLTTVNYASGMDPKPFIYEAADVNADTRIDILDVVGIINVILGPQDRSMLQSEPEATISIVDNILYIDTPVDLAGIQFDFATTPAQHITVLDALRGFETTGSWIGEDNYRFMAFNLNGKTIAAGKHALLDIAGANVSDARLSDAFGGNVAAAFASVSGVDLVDKDANKVQHALPGVYNMMGVKVGESQADMDRLPAGVYIVNGWKVVK